MRLLKNSFSISVILCFLISTSLFAQKNVLHKDNSPVYSIPVPEERFIDKIVYTKEAVIIYARFKSAGRITFFSAKGKHPWTLINTANRKEKVMLKDVKNIKKDKVLLKDALGKESEFTHEMRELTASEFTCEIYFPPLPETMKVADLIEGDDVSKRGEAYTVFFDFKKLRLKTFPKAKPDVGEPAEETVEPVVSETTVETINELKEGESLVLNNILFQSSKAILLPAAYVELDKVVAAMKKNMTMEIEVSGHTDNVGKYADDKLRLSRERADAVKNYLMNNGVVGTRISTKGYGDTVPLNDNSSPEKRKQNRRVEIKILKK